MEHDEEDDAADVQTPSTPYDPASAGRIRHSLGTLAQFDGVLERFASVRQRHDALILSQGIIMFVSVRQRRDAIH